MAEPKKETVRIVLPARRDGTPVSSNPRETAMINLPPKPVPVQGAPVIPTGLKPPTTSLTPPPPSMPKPPSMPAIPKPPSSAGVMPPAAGPSIPKPPVMPPAATIPPMAPKPPTVPPAPGAAPTPPSAPIPPVAPKPPSSGTTPLKPVAPAPLQAEAKKETAKVPASTPGSKGVMPQATVQLQKKPDASKSVATTSIAVTPAGDSTSSDLSPVLGIAALVVALLSLGVQLWMML